MPKYSETGVVTDGADPLLDGACGFAVLAAIACKTAFRGELAVGIREETKLWGVDGEKRPDNQFCKKRTIVASEGDESS